MSRLKLIPSRPAWLTALLLMVAGSCVIPFPARAATSSTGGALKGKLNFEEHVRPILKAHCFDCHGEGDRLRGGLDLRLQKSMLKGGDSGPALVPGNPSQSRMVQLLENGEMPKRERKPSGSEIELIRRWVAQGAKVLRPEPDSLPLGMQISAEERSHWAFRPLVRPEVPRTGGGGRVRNPIDSFIASAQAKAGVGFGPDADRAVLIRRVFQDLWGLPPGPADVEDFLADPRPDAYERLVDRLLDSPHYGERWARHWLDVAGYADSDGYTTDDTPRPFAYKYRDYVIRSIAAGKPYDRFITEQLAGDELAIARFGSLEAAARDEAGRELLIATGYLRMAADGTASGGVDQEVARNQVVADTIKIVSTSLMGLTVACAQCHDHRYDPIPQSDYYRLRAVFEPAYDWKQWRRPSERLISLYTAEERKKASDVEAEAVKLSTERETKLSQFIDEALKKHLEKYDATTREALWTAFKTPADKRTEAQKALLKANPSANISAGVLYQYNPKAVDELKAMDAKIAEVRARKPPEDFISVLTEPSGKAPPTYRFHRGDPKQPKEEILPGTLTILASHRVGEDVGLKPVEVKALSSGRRLAFAGWVTSTNNPLLSRVLVNRVWMHHFGRPIVGSPADFGLQGERPTHPELLDWLAAAFSSPVSQDPSRPGLGWELKKLHRLILTSTTYRQSSAMHAKHSRRDPENRLYWRKPLHRLDAEAIRDTHLAISGVLSRKMYGPPVPVREDVVGQIVVGVDKKQGDNKMPVDVPMGEEEFRRSVYVEVRRSRPLAFLNTFDAPVMEVNCEKRQSSTVAPQALMLMNSDFVVQQAGLFAGRLMREGGVSSSSRVRTAFRLALGRAPSKVELQQSLDFLENQQAHFLRVQREPTEKAAKTKEPLSAELQALTNLCQTLLSANELLYLD